MTFGGHELFKTLEQKFGDVVVLEYVLPSVVFYSAVADYINSISNYKDTKVKLLDVGSSYGYGVYILSELCKNCDIVGVDINRSALSVAEKRLKSSRRNIDFKAVNILDTNEVSQIISEYGKFDVITCFEVFEHIPRDKSEILLRNLNMLLSNNGYLFISTPNKLVYDSFAFTKDHINEVTVNEFVSALEKYFEIVKVYGSGLHSRLMIYLFWKFGLIARMDSTKVSLTWHKKILRKILRGIFEPRELYLSILKKMRHKEYLLRKLSIYSLNSMPEKSALVFVITKKKMVDSNPATP
ncbi:methyltransferase domain-containing protein [Thermococcus sp. SY098]|uniref:class I SAM-dependent methyltransferase n=1 Tax=Thermococcus sp. SY098 TaxID=3111325 RepID=UPI002D78C1F1|nr:methyltransferase domain-containing protein [Thermococcus sp. SY098]WRS51982.1 methyltransferase domain-containing protein [Thermococcus sp. SY098]